MRKRGRPDREGIEGVGSVTEYQKYCTRRGDLTTDDFYPPEYYPDDLRECPFCGNIVSRKLPDGRINFGSLRVERKELCEGLNRYDPMTVFFVMCRKCYARSGNAMTIRDAVNRWNTRI